MAWTKKPELVAAARNIVRSVPDRIVAVAFLEDGDGEQLEMVDLGEDEPTLTGAELDEQGQPTPSKTPPSS